MREVTLSVPDMKCGGCVASVTEALEAVEGVSSVETSLDTKESQVIVEEQVTDDQLTEAVKGSGFSASIQA
jgi:copper chaperone CopZ